MVYRDNYYLVSFLGVTILWSFKVLDLATI